MALLNSIMIILMIIRSIGGVEIPNTNRVKMEVSYTNDCCSRSKISDGLLSVKNCQGVVRIEDLKEINTYQCNDIQNYLFFGPITVHFDECSCHLIGMVLCNPIPGNPYVTSTVCPGPHNNDFKTMATILITFSALIPILLTVLFRWVFLRKILCLKPTEVLASISADEEGKYHMLFTTEEKIEKNLVPGRTNILRLCCRKVNRTHDPLYPTAIKLAACENIGAKGVTVNKTQLMIMLLLTFNFNPVLSCSKPELTSLGSSVFTLQQGSTICTKSGLLRIEEVYHMFSKTRQYFTHPWCMDTDGWHGNDRICGGKNLCQSRGITGIPNNTIEHSAIPYEEYCSASLGFKTTKNIRRMHCFYIEPTSNDVIWKGGAEWYYANCRDFRMRILFDEDRMYSVSKISQDFIHIKASESGSLSCKFHPFYTETYKDEHLSLVESLKSNEKFLCPLPTNAMQPKSGTLGDFQTKGDGKAVVDWMSFQCEANIDFQKCIGQTSFIQSGLKDCTKLPGQLGRSYFYISDGKLISKMDNSLISGTLICDKEENFIFDKIGNCSISHAALWGVKESSESLRLTVTLTSGKEDECMTLRSSCFHHDKCLPCDGVARILYIDDNDCSDIRINFTDNTLTNDQLTSTDIDYSYKFDPAATKSSSGMYIGEWFKSPLHLGLLGLNSSVIIIFIVLLVCSKSGR